MKSILQNPYRIAGLLAGATTAQIRTKINYLRMDIKAGNRPSYDDGYSLPVLGYLPRTFEQLDAADLKLNFDSDKMEAALFWFCNANSKDEEALNFLKKNKKKEAIDIWKKNIPVGKIDENSWSAYHNLSTLYLSDGSLENGLPLKIKFLENKFAKDFVRRVIGQTYTITQKELELLFLETLKQDIEQSGGIRALRPMIIPLAKLFFVAKNDFFDNLVLLFDAEIERLVEATAKKRKANPANATKAGIQLLQEVVDLLDSVKLMKGTNSHHYGNCADKVAEELLQCAIETYNSCRNTDGNLGADFRDAIMCLKTLIESAYEHPSTDNALRLLEEAKPLLSKLKNAERSNKTKEQWEKDVDRLLDEVGEIAVGNRVRNRYEENKKIILPIYTANFYLTLSTRVAQVAEQMCIKEIKALQEMATKKPRAFFLLKEVTEKAMGIYCEIDEMDVEEKFRTTYRTTKQELDKVLDNLPSTDELVRIIIAKEAEEEKERDAAKTQKIVMVVAVIVIGLVIYLCNK